MQAVQRKSWRANRLRSRRRLGCCELVQRDVFHAQARLSVANPVVIWTARSADDEHARCYNQRLTRNVIDDRGQFKNGGPRRDPLRTGQW